MAVAELADPVGPLEVGQHEDVEEFGTGSGTEGDQAGSEPTLELVGSHGWEVAYRRGGRRDDHP
jgi:hypothetical protein